jgi:hypothetical protein
MPMRERSGQGGMMDSGQGGMMGGDMQPMMRMMHERMAREEMDGPMGMMHLDHIEGRIAFLKTELGITDAQKPQWDAFADALRTQAGRMKSVREEIMQGRAPETWPDLLGREEHMLLVRVNALKAIEEPARALYAALSPEQQKKANELMRHPMGGL